MTTRRCESPPGVGGGALNLRLADPTGFAGATKYKKPGFTVGDALLFFCIGAQGWLTPFRA